MRPLAMVCTVILVSMWGLGQARAQAGYVSAGIGGGANLGGTIGTSFQTEESSSGRVGIGQRIGPVAVEASLFGAGMIGQSNYVGVGQEYDTLSAGVALKYYVSLAGPLELYGKGGINKTWLQEPDGSPHDYDGRGWDLGGGLQFSFAGILNRTGIWLDFTHQETELRDADKAELDGSVRMLTLGLSVGI